MTIHTSKALRLLATTLTISFIGITHAQVENPAELSTTPAEAALTHYPASGDTNYPPETPQPLQFRPASERTDIGRATGQLLTLQREATTQNPRLIDGEQASRSYARYLKSFETEIPEFYETGVKTGSGD